MKKIVTVKNNLLAKFKKKDNIVEQNIDDNDIKHRKTLWDIPRFFAIILLITLFSRATAGAILSNVNVAYSYSGTITNQIQKNGVIEYTKKESIDIPKDIEIVKALVEQGQSIEIDQPLIEFEKQSVDLALQTLDAQLFEMNTKKQTLLNNKPVNSSSLVNAQATIDWAEYDKEMSYIDNTQAVNIANRKYNATVAELILLNKDSENLEERLENATKNYNSAASDLRSIEYLDGSNSDNATIIDAVNKRYNTANKDLQELKIISENLKIANENCETAKDNLSKAHSISDYAKAQKENALQLAQNAFNQVEDELEQSTKDTNLSKQSNLSSVKLLEIDIVKQNDLILELKNIQENNYLLNAHIAGTMTELDILNYELGGNTVGTISDTSEGYTLRFPLSKEEYDDVALGQEIEITQNSNKSKSKISYIRDNDDKYEAVANLPADKFRVGSSKISLTLSKNNYPMCLPSSSVHKDNNGSFIYVVIEENTILGLQNLVSRVNVTIIDEADGITAVSGALSSESKVITSSTKAIKVGDRVRITI